MAQIFKNNCSGTLSSAITALAANIVLTPNQGNLFPTVTGDDFFLVTLIGTNAQGAESVWEIVKCVAKAADTLTVIRGQEGTTALAWPAGTKVELRLTAGSVVTPDVLDGKEDIGTAAAAMTAHTGDADPHPQYALQQQLGTVLASYPVSLVNNLQAGDHLEFDGSKWANTPKESLVGGGTSNPNPETLTYTYTGVLDVPITSLPGTAEMVVASPLGKERAYGILLSAANYRLTGLEFPNLEFISNFSPTSMPSLTSLSLPALVTVGGNFSFSYMSSLTSLNLPALTIVGGNFSPNYMAALTSLNLPALTTVAGSFNPNYMPALTSLSLTALTTVGGTFNTSNLNSLTSLNLTALTTVGSNFNPSNMSSLASLSLPALTTVGGNFYPNNMNSLTSLSLPAVEVIGASLTSGNAIQINNGTAALTSFTLPTTLKQVGGSAGNVTITSAALDQASVDNILERLASLDGTNGTVEFSNRTVTITGTSSTPSAAGLAAKATLVARGCTVTYK